MAPPVDIEDPHPVETIHSSVSPRSSHTPPTLVPVVLRISPSHDGGPSGFIYLDVYELNDQAAITAYFANAGRVTTVLPCQNFDEFLVSNSLSTRQVSFLSDLPASIVAMGRHILAENAASEEAGPDLSWLPRSPSMSSATLLSHPARSVPRSANITTRVGTGRSSRSSRPDPDGTKATTVSFATTPTVRVFHANNIAAMFTYELGAGGHSLSERNRKRVGFPILRPSTKRVGLANGSPAQQSTSVGSYSNSCLIGQHALTRLMIFPDLFQYLLIPWGVPLSPWGVLSRWFQFLLFPSIHPTRSLAPLLRRRYRVPLLPRTNLPIWISSPSPTRRSLNNSRPMSSTQQFAAVVLHLTICR